MTELHNLSVAEGSSLLAARKISPVEWTRALLERISVLDKHVNSFIHVSGGVAIEQAREAEKEIAAGRRRGDLHGVPYGLKDLFDTAGIPTTGHSHIAQGRIPSRDSAVYARLKGAGAVLIGKLAMHEFAHGGPSLDLPWPPARNPWNPAHYAGSSSSGSGAAVGAGFVPTALGTDTAGSIRHPAGMCGLAGLKPTYGLVSRSGVIPLSQSLDVCGPLAWTSCDCALVLQAIAGHDTTDPSSRRLSVPNYTAGFSNHLRGLRIGVIRHFWEEDTKPSGEAVAALESALMVLRDLGAELEEVRLRRVREYNDVRVILQEPEVFALHEADIRTQPEKFSQDFLGRVLAGVLIPAYVTVQANRQRRRMANEMLGVLRCFDALVTIGQGPASRFDAENTYGFLFGLWAKENLNSPFSVAGIPALNVCTGFSSSGLPLSMQFAGRPFDEATILRIGNAFELATTWHSRRPFLDKDAKPVPLQLAPPAPLPPCDSNTRAFVDSTLLLAELELSEGQRQLLYAAAPYALSMARRILRESDWFAEPATTFAVPLSGDAL